LKNHAVVRARFALDCLQKAKELTSDLVATLGLETADLQLRIGLNSGPTTAGGKYFFLIISITFLQRLSQTELLLTAVIHFIPLHSFKR
jgi:hypothetical protein